MIPQIHAQFTSHNSLLNKKKSQVVDELQAWDVMWSGM
jgi:hypothetical protein